MLICAKEILIIIIIIITIIIIVINTIVKLCHNRSQILRSRGHVEGADQTNLQNDELTTKILSLRLLDFFNTSLMKIHAWFKQEFRVENNANCFIKARLAK